MQQKYAYIMTYDINIIIKETVPKLNLDQCRWTFVYTNSLTCIKINGNWVHARFMAYLWHPLQPLHNQEIGKVFRIYFNELKWNKTD